MYDVSTSALRIKGKVSAIKSLHGPESTDMNSYLADLSSFSELNNLQSMSCLLHHRFANLGLGRHLFVALAVTAPRCPFAVEKPRDTDG